MTAEKFDPTKTVQEHMDDAAEEPTMDDYFRRDPKTLTEEDYHNFIRLQRESRAQFQEKDHKKEPKDE